MPALGDRGKEDRSRVPFRRCWATRCEPRAAMDAAAGRRSERHADHGGDLARTLPGATRNTQALTRKQCGTRKKSASTPQFTSSVQVDAALAAHQRRLPWMRTTSRSKKS